MEADEFATPFIITIVRELTPHGELANNVCSERTTGSSTLLLSYVHIFLCLYIVIYRY